MAELLTVARPYAKAAFQHAQEQGSLDHWSQMLSFVAAVAADESMRELLANPKANSDEKAQLFSSVCGDRVDDSMRNFIRQLADTGRLSALPEICAQFEALKSQKEQSIDAEFVTAFPLSDDQFNNLVNSLNKKMGRYINAKTTVDQSLLGGLIIKAGDMVIDGSVRGKLAKLADQLNS